jgi:hypothetical protein
VPTPDVAALLRRIASALKPLGVRWYVFGAQAVVAAGAARATADIDITTEDVPPARLIEALAGAGFELRPGIADLDSIVEELRVVPLQHAASGFQLDVVRAGPGIEEQMLERAIVRNVGRTPIPFIETNDLIVLKVLAGRGKDLDDVRTLLRMGLAEVSVDTVRSRLRDLEHLLDDSTLIASFDRLRPRRETKPRRR